ncbi:RT0821/Lpp0805 family surface protein [Arenibaculum pallidiluteum]|uniref:RT0821/Lpp0805 family surface protein n=1 Tax=Arenibaculum pallidiluteum TaxID=2812559 RepID=UPI001A96C885|nr:RT0821/Lpp0805 family surface protein [Arenibaculum pallidiluteum]
MRKILIAATVTLALAGCQTNGYGTKQAVGTLGGAAAGGLAGAQFGKGTGNLVATGAGVLLGAFLGSELGQSLDRADQMAATQAASQAYAAPMGQTISWQNPQTGNSGTITPIREGQTQTGAYCREFQQTINVGGRMEQANGRACRQQDGSWQIVG